MKTPHYALMAAVTALVLALGVAPALAGKGGTKGPSADASAPSGETAAVSTATSSTSTSSTTNSTSTKGGGGNTTTVSSSIWVASVTTSGGAATQPALGTNVAFGTTIQKLSGGEWPMVGLRCFQDLTGDGSIDESFGSLDLVYSQLDTPSAVFSLGGASSYWKMLGGAATCRADLYAYGMKGQQETIRLLASTGNWGASG